jgi:hypothetical protein
MTLNITISIAPKREPAVLPIGRNGTDGKIANIQKIAKDIEPKTTVGIGAKAIFFFARMKFPEQEKENFVKKNDENMTFIALSESRCATVILQKIQF